MKLPVDTSRMPFLVVAPAEPLKQCECPGDLLVAVAAAAIAPLSGALAQLVTQLDHMTGRDPFRRGRPFRALMDRVVAIAYRVAEHEVLARPRGGGRPAGGRRGFTRSERSTAVDLVRGGATLRAGVVGASEVTVLKWVRKAA